MSIIINNNKVIKATGSLDQIIADFNEYLEFIQGASINEEKSKSNDSNVVITDGHPEDTITILTQENSNLKKENADIKAAFATQLENLENTCNSLAALTIDNEKLKNENLELAYKNSTLKQTILMLESAIKRLSNYSRNDNIALEGTNKEKVAKVQEVDIGSKPQCPKYEGTRYGFIIHRANEDPTSDVLISHITLVMNIDHRYFNTAGHQIDPEHACCIWAPIGSYAEDCLKDIFNEPNNATYNVRFHH